MFHRVTDASKIALCHLMDHLRARKFELFDTQVLSPLTARLGAIEIRRRDYLERLAAALRKSTRVSRPDLGRKLRPMTRI